MIKYNKTDITIFGSGNTLSNVLACWKYFCSVKNNNGKLQNFVISAKTNSPTGYSGATSLPPIGKSSIYTETSCKNHGNIVFVFFERTDFIQISDETNFGLNISYNRFSILTNDSLKSMGRFRIQLLLPDNTWSTRYKIPKKGRYNN